jgi:hypothetical protein
MSSYLFIPEKQWASIIFKEWRVTRTFSYTTVVKELRSELICHLPRCITTVESAESGVTTVRFNSNITSDTNEVDNPEEFRFRLPMSSYVLPDSASTLSLIICLPHILDFLTSMLIYLLKLIIG